MTNYNDDGKRKFGRLRNIANIGDIVIIADYGALEFQVEGIRFETEVSLHLEAESISYDVIDLRTYQYMEAYQEDVSVVCRADKADEYLRAKGEDTPKPPHASSIDMDFGWTSFPDLSELSAGWEWVGEMDFVREEENPMTKTGGKYNKSRVDELLVELSDYNDLIKNFGDEDGEYAKKIETIKSTLRYMTGGK